MMMMITVSYIRTSGKYLLELKCAHLSPTWYAPKPWRLQEEAQGKSCLVVEKRAVKVAAEDVRKAQRTDQTYCGTAPGTVGPVEARVRTFDKTVPLCSARSAMRLAPR